MNYNLCEKEIKRNEEKRRNFFADFLKTFSKSFFEVRKRKKSVFKILLFLIIILNFKLKIKIKNFNFKIKTAKFI